MVQLDALTILGPTGTVASLLPGYEVRDEQLRMAKAVAEAIQSGYHLMVEAGTGVGKSFAYLVPGILAATEQGKRVVVSTRTINLQNQLIDKDIPFLRSAMRQDFQAVLVKGRSNFISVRRLDAALARAGSTPSSSLEIDQLSHLLRWSKATSDGSLADLDFKPLESVWESVRSDSGNCLKQSCPRYRECHFFKMARKAWSANLLIVNHALYMSDLALRTQGASLLPDHDVAVFDEAHTLADVAADHLGLRVASGAIANLLNSLFNEKTRSGLLAYHQLKHAQAQTSRALAAANAFFDAAAAWREQTGPSNGRVARPIALPEDLIEELRVLSSVIGRDIKTVGLPEQRIELESAQSNCLRLAADLSSWLRQGQAEGGYWVEVERDRVTGRSVLLAHAPIDVGPILRRQLYERGSSCIFTSGTLSVGSPPSFQFARDRLGLSNGVKTLHLGSPFNYQRQVTIYIARIEPDPTSQGREFDHAAIHAIPRFVQKTQGKALVLFTSHGMMADASRQLKPWFRKAGITLLTQSSGSPAPKLLQAFKDDLNSVLFGTDNFWQGIDVPGPSLSNVIITRLPFGPPSRPLLEARSEAFARRGGDFFHEYQLPEAVLKFKQAFGRLVRSKSDTGIIVILDPRVLTKAYGWTFLNSVPPCPRIEE
jgi:ATP-dependent DNA helicase DinG